ncbi:MAG TPA: histidine phosphatase family protein [Thermoflexales bacterium]|nr:histidine phosphatase family protein [Thermoflexales bacterium]
MTQLWLIRHGQTDWNVQRRWQGQSPNAPSINALGVAQARAVADELADTPFDALYASDLPRAVETANIIAARIGLPVQIDPRLREISQGDWEGLTPREISERYPHDWRVRHAEDTISHRAPGGETPNEVGERFLRAITEIANRHAGGAVVIVSHGFVIGTLLAHAQGLPFGRARELVPDNAHPHVLEWPLKGEGY